MKKTKLLALFPVMAMMLTSCGQHDWIIKYDPNKVYNIGICQLVTHDALDAATNGFIKAVEDGLGKDKSISTNKSPLVIPPHVRQLPTPSFLRKLISSWPTLHQPYKPRQIAPYQFQFLVHPLLNTVLPSA